MNWFKKIRSILGYFWCEFWDDQWLVDLITKIHNFIVGESLESRIQHICQQTAVFNPVAPDYTYPIKVLVSRYPSSNTLDVSQFNVGSSDIGASDSGFLYEVYSQFVSPDIIGFRPSVQSSRKNFDVQYYPDRNQLFSSVNLQKAGFLPSLQNVNGTPTECLVLWANYDRYNTLRDSFTGVLQLPIDWLYKYPGIISVAWTMKHTGATIELVKQFFSCMGISSDVYLGQSGLPTSQKLSGIYVLTDVGYLFAVNQSQSLSDSCIPLKDISDSTFAVLETVSEAYKERCQQLQGSDIYVQLPTTLNPAEFIFQKLWGASAGLVILDKTVDEQDMAIATQFIGKNVVKGSILQIYGPSSNSTPVLLYPNLTKAQTLLSYYNNSIGNTLVYTHTQQ